MDAYLDEFEWRFNNRKRPGVAVLTGACVIVSGHEGMMWHLGVWEWLVGVAAEFFATIFFVHVAGWTAGGRLAATFQGSNSSMRLIGWSAMRVRTWCR